MPTCLITGATGLIGTQLIKTLPVEWQIYALSRQPHKPQPGERPIHTVVADLNDMAQVAGLPPQIDAVIHLAQSEHFRDFPNKALDVFQVNVASTLHLLDYARRAGAKTFVLASSGGVYGHDEEGFQEDATVAPQADLGFYLSSKLCAEIVAENYTALLNVIILRFFFVYGPSQRKSMLIPRLVQSVIEGRPITLQGQDGIRINPTHVSDAAQAIVRTLDLAGSHKINIGGPEVLSLRQIGEMIGTVVGREPQFETQLEVTPRHLVGDIGKMTQVLLAPQVHFTAGIQTLLNQEGKLP